MGAEMICLVFAVIAMGLVVASIMSDWDYEDDDDYPGPFFG
jgi:hypothetical protein